MPAYVYSGSQTFRLVGTGRHEDTLRIESKSSEKERFLKLVLPTLCITYANMEFANKIGGEQKNYPDSADYGPKYFDPPVVITGAAEIERLTWIRGADKVAIGPERTEIDWRPWRTLVVPRLHIEREKPAEGRIGLDNFTIPSRGEIVINVMQLSDGRHVGGLRIAKRHPDWKPPQIEPKYDLWVRVIDGRTMRPLPEALVLVSRWDTQASKFQVTDRVRTDGSGAIHLPARASDELEAVVVYVKGGWTRARCFRPLAGQRVRLHIPVWSLKESSVAHVWQSGDMLRAFADLSGFTSREILARNRLRTERELKEGKKISLPCWDASLWLESGEHLESIAKAFAYGSVEEFLELNQAKSSSDLEREGQLLLPGWNFFYARKDDTLPKIDKLFRLPAGSSRTVGKVYHADRRTPFELETIAVPTKTFRKKNAGNF